VSETKREHWSKLIAEQEASGQTARAFCRGRGVGEYAFYHWRRRLRKTKSLVRFALLETSSKAPSAEMVAELELVLKSGERLRIGNGVDAAALRLVLGIIRQ
jgi:hypothetical protein